MKKFFSLLILLVAFASFAAPPILRNSYTTNATPTATSLAGSGILLTNTLPPDNMMAWVNTWRTMTNGGPFILYSIGDSTGGFWDAAIAYTFYTELRKWMGTNGGVGTYLPGALEFSAVNGASRTTGNSTTYINSDFWNLSSGQGVVYGGAGVGYVPASSFYLEWMVEAGAGTLHVRAETASASTLLATIDCSSGTANTALATNLSAVHDNYQLRVTNTLAASKVLAVGIWSTNAAAGVVGRHLSQPGVDDWLTRYPLSLWTNAISKLPPTMAIFSEKNGNETGNTMTAQWLPMLTGFRTHWTNTDFILLNATVDAWGPTNALLQTRALKYWAATNNASLFYDGDLATASISWITNAGVLNPDGIHLTAALGAPYYAEKLLNQMGIRESSVIRNYTNGIGWWSTQSSSSSSGGATYWSWTTNNLAIHTGTTTETTLASAVIPSGTLGLNGVVRITILTTNSNNANTKSIEFKVGSTYILSKLLLTSSTGGKCVRDFVCLGSNTTKMAWPATDTTVNQYATTTGTFSTFSADSSSDMTITFRGLLSNSGDAIAVQYILVEAWKR